MKPLREGFTTGSAAAGAALAALILLVEGRAPKNVSVPLPPFHVPTDGRTPLYAHARCSSFVRVPVEQCRLFDVSGAKAAVRKDGGDDPDVTSGALIVACVTFDPKADGVDIQLNGGQGVGRVTLPGLPVPVGEAAINPGPREQIRVALSQYVEKYARRFGPCPELAVVISVPEGEALASRTLNPRLGIVGGISILGTRGIVCPFSHTAWQATVRKGLDVALTSGCATVCLSTGRRSEALLMEKYPHLLPQAFIQAADFAAFSLRAAGPMPFTNIVWGCFFGKLLKLAQGMEYTHARKGSLDLGGLALLCPSIGALRADAVQRCITAAQALDILLADEDGQRVITVVTEKASREATRFTGRAVRLHLFHTDGRLLCTA
ncbi:MAG: cobalt-precorrin-5B (C(1))-methyltransferase CbiD [Desulfovibrio sp.]|jgi:cobalt-precorrin-5B (C1)-methyltransferase|nr:cobalt-precorrin-5B (C(1))-methyltransferase CbiD [Desulfovibrio sp.]